MHNQDVGRQGEAVARRLLLAKGFQVLEMNYRAGRWGELDLICLDDDVLVFVEVKSRHGESFGQAVEAVSWGKRQRLRRAAQYYKLTHPNTPEALRFDVVTVDYAGPDPKIAHLPNIDMS